MGALQADGGFRAALLLLLCGGINHGVAESHRRVAIATPRGPQLRPAQPPMRGAFFASGLGPPLFVSKRGIKARAAESSRRVPHQRDPQTRRRNDAMAWSTPEVREVCVGHGSDELPVRGDVIIARRPSQSGRRQPIFRPINADRPARHSDSVHIDRVDRAEGTRDGRFKLRQLSWARSSAARGD